MSVAAGALLLLVYLFYGPRLPEEMRPEVARQPPQMEERPASPVAPEPCVPARVLARVDGGTRQVCPIIGLDNCTRAGPEACRAHHPAFAPYAAVAWSGRFEREYVRDFLGLRTLYGYDCTNARYRPNHLERQVPCNEHEDHTAKRVEQYEGPWPIASEEYWEWVDCLEAVNDAVRASRPFVAIELGARYGTWIARAAKAYELLTGREARIVGVEGDPVGFGWMRDHLALNGLTHGAEMIQAAMGARDGDVVHMSWEGPTAAVRTLSLATLLVNETGEVDLLDVDIQGAELDMFAAPGAMAAMARKVRRIHVGTHSHDIHRRLIALFRSHGWLVVYEHEGRHNARLWEELDDTPMGLMHFNDGVLSMKRR